jgi:motility quorum-sensing regulator/GCU-specific mRNA interferase toxin
LTLFPLWGNAKYGKFIASYDLSDIKLLFSDEKQLRMTATALRDCHAVGFNRFDIVDVIQQLQRKDFIKSTNTYSDHKLWQDVYNTVFCGYKIYIKFQKDEISYFVISFKEK